MKFYAAGLLAFITDAPLYSFIHDHALGSYFGERDNLNRALEYYPHIFLDSGAFSAWTEKVTIKIEEYSKFLCRYSEKLDVYANLDVIGDPVGTLKNQNILEKDGLNPLPVFHNGEDMKYLDDYVGSYDYVALGGMVGSKTNDKWLDIIFSKYPDHKFHGFGLTDIALIRKYPFYSVDSTSWFSSQKFGTIMFPNGKTSHYDELNSNQLEYIKKSGFDIKMMKIKYQTRNAFNLLVTKRMINSIEYNKINKLEYNNITEEFK